MPSDRPRADPPRPASTAPPRSKAPRAPARRSVRPRSIRREGWSAPGRHRRAEERPEAERREAGHPGNSRWQAARSVRMSTVRRRRCVAARSPPREPRPATVAPGVAGRRVRGAFGPVGWPRGRSVRTSPGWRRARRTISRAPPRRPAELPAEGAVRAGRRHRYPESPGCPTGAAARGSLAAASNRSEAGTVAALRTRAQTSRPPEPAAGEPSEGRRSWPSPGGEPGRQPRERGRERCPLTSQPPAGSAPPGHRRWTPKARSRPARWTKRASAGERTRSPIG